MPHNIESHTRMEIVYFKDKLAEAEAALEDILKRKREKMKKAKNNVRKKVASHLKGDIKGFKKEIKEDVDLLKTLKKKKSEKKRI